MERNYVIVTLCIATSSCLVVLPTCAYCESVRCMVSALARRRPWNDDGRRQGTPWRSVRRLMIRTANGSRVEPCFPSSYCTQESVGRGIRPRRHVVVSRLIATITIASCWLQNKCPQNKCSPLPDTCPGKLPSWTFAPVLPPGLTPTLI